MFQNNLNIKNSESEIISLENALFDTNKKLLAQAKVSSDPKNPDSNLQNLNSLIDTINHVNSLSNKLKKYLPSSFSIQDVVTSEDVAKHTEQPDDPCEPQEEQHHRPEHAQDWIVVSKHPSSPQIFMSIDSNGDLRTRARLRP